MAKQIIYNDIHIELIRKPIKNIYLRVYPPDGHVKVSAPLKLNSAIIKTVIDQKTAWIKQQQHKIRARSQGVTHQSYYVWGRCYSLKEIPHYHPQKIVLTEHELLFYSNVEISAEKKHKIMDAWYRTLLQIEISRLINKWQPIINVEVKRFFMQKMKTRWGSCNYRDNHIRLNTELAKKPLICLEYVVVHEMVHLLEPSHNRHFYQLMTEFMPNWQDYRQQLNHF